MISLMIVVSDEGPDLHFEVAWQIVVLEQDPVFQGLLPTFNLALSLRVIGRTSYVLHIPIVKPFGQITGDIARAIVGHRISSLM